MGANDSARAREFDLVVAAHERRLGQFLVQMVGSGGGMAEDLLQETFLVAFRERDELRRVDNVSAWLFAIARNRALHALRTRRRREAGLWRMALFQEGSDDLSEAVAVRDLLERFLDPEERALLILRYVHGFHSRELAEITGASPQAVRQRLSRARRRLLDQLTETAEAHPRVSGRQPAGVAPPELAEYLLEEPLAKADGRRLKQLLAPLMTVAPAERREPSARLSWRRLRRRDRL